MTDENATVSETTDSAATLPTEVAPPADESTDETAPADTAEGDQSQADKDAQDASEAGRKLAERKRSAQERIAHITKEKHDALREVQRLKNVLDRYEQEKRPDPAHYTDQDEFDQQSAAYTAKQLRKNEIALEAQELEGKALEAALTAFNERAEDFAREVPTFNPDALAPLIQGRPGAQTLAREVLESDMGPQLAHKLAQNPREAVRIASLPERQMVRELVKLEMSLAAPPPKKLTQAPTPVKSVGGAATKSSEPDITKLANDMEAYAAFRRPKQG